MAAGADGSAERDTSKNSARPPGGSGTYSSSLERDESDEYLVPRRRLTPLLQNIGTLPKNA